MGRESPTILIERNTAYESSKCQRKIKRNLKSVHLTVFGIGSTSMKAKREVT